MRRWPNMRVLHHRLIDGEEGGVSGLYEFVYRGARLRVIASDGLGWDHVSVSTRSRCPTWEEMAYIKSLFFRDDETAIEFHVPVSDHINQHPYCLHLWRPNDGREIPRPDAALVGVRTA